MAVAVWPLLCQVPQRWKKASCSVKRGMGGFGFNSQTLSIFSIPGADSFACLPTACFGERLRRAQPARLIEHVHLRRPERLSCSIHHLSLALCGRGGEGGTGTIICGQEMHTKMGRGWISFLSHQCPPLGSFGEGV